MTDIVPYVFEYKGNGQKAPRDVVNVRFHPSVIEVDDDAFLGCEKLETVTFNKGLKKIGDRSFTICTSLGSITLPSTLIDIHTGAFYGCSGLKDVVLNEGLKQIAQGGFYKCTSLERVTFPSTFEEIGKYAFSGCSNLREILLNEGLQKIGKGAFRNCPSLERFKLHSISTRLYNIIQTRHYPSVEAKIDEFCGCGVAVERRGSELFVTVAVMTIDGNWNKIRARLDQIVDWIRYYEVKEVTTLFELALWKAKIDQLGEDDDATSREACRIDVPGPVKDTILQYL